MMKVHLYIVEGAALIRWRRDMTTRTFERTDAPDWLLAMKEIDEKTFGAGFDCFVNDAICNLGVAD